MWQGRTGSSCRGQSSILNLNKNNDGFWSVLHVNFFFFLRWLKKSQPIMWFCIIVLIIRCHQVVGAVCWEIQIDGKKMIRSFWRPISNGVAQCQQSLKECLCICNSNLKKKPSRRKYKRFDWPWNPLRY